jgi:hypothetical protein
VYQTSPVQNILVSCSPWGRPVPPVCCLHTHLPFDVDCSPRTAEMQIVELHPANSGRAGGADRHAKLELLRLASRFGPW